ncbi:hypothetical protein MKX03_000817 [Papaver bracteatum]|nr:hypothetical protein MKX03_000817 [Papaver bracteatum]
MAPRKKKTKTASNYLNAYYKKTHDNFYSDKKVISERYIDYESLPNYPISQCFSGKNMIASLIHIRGPAPIGPVLLFYSQIHNLSEKDQSFDVYIEGKTHTITPDLIANCLGLERPVEPLPFPPTSEHELVVSRDDFRNAVLLPEHKNWTGRCPRSEIKVGCLKPTIKLLVKICQSNILPIPNNHQTTNLSSVYLSFLLLRRYQVDISYVIWNTMACVAPNCGRTTAVPYGIIVGQLLAYLGHPCPADSPCTSVPITFGRRVLGANRLPYDPRDSNDGPLYELHSGNISPLPPPSSCTDDDDASELPLPNDPPRESFGQFVCLSDSIQSLKDTMEVILSHFEQQHDDFMQQKKMIEDIAHRQNRLEQQHEEFGQQMKMIDSVSTKLDRLEQQQQEVISRIDLQHKHLEQQHDAIAEQRKTIDQIGTQHDLLGLHIEEFKHLGIQQDRYEQQQQEMIDCIARQNDRFEQLQQEMINRMARQHDQLEQKHKEFAEQQKTVDRIATQHDLLGLHLEEFKPQRKRIDCLATQQDRCEKQQQEIIDRIARQDDCFEQQQQEIIDRTARQNDRFEKLQQEIINLTACQDDRFEQLQQEIVNHTARQDDLFEKQHEEFAQLQKMSDSIVTQQDCLKLRLEEFKQQRKRIGHLAFQQDRCEQQQQEMIDCIARQDNRIEHQLEEFAQLRKMSDRIASQQERLEDFKQQTKRIDSQQNQKMIGGNARKHDSLARRQTHYQAMLMKDVERAYPGQVNPICRKCGDSGNAVLLIYCTSCQTSAEHSYCLDKMPKNGEKALWTCEECERTARLHSQQGVQLTSSKEVSEDRSNSVKKRKLIYRIR